MSASKLRGQRISEADLIKESQQVLIAAGVPHHERSRFVSGVAEEVVRNPDPVLCQLQPKMVVHTSGAWIRAYQLIFAYLADHEMSLTEETARLELTTLDQPIQGSTEIVSDIGELDFEAGQDAFRDRVERYSKAGQQSAESEPEPIEAVESISESVSTVSEKDAPPEPEEEIPPTPAEPAKPEKKVARKASRPKPDKGISPKVSATPKDETPVSPAAAEPAKSPQVAPPAVNPEPEPDAEPAPEPAKKKRQKATNISPQAPASGGLRPSPKSGTRSRAKKAPASGN
jgi:hypothetical protein